MLKGLNPGDKEIWLHDLERDWAAVAKASETREVESKDPKWNFVKESEGIRVWSRIWKVNGRKLPSAIAIGVIDVEPEVLAHFIMDIKKRPLWEPGVHVEMAGHVADEGSVDCVYSYVNSYLGGLISSRDFLTAKGYKVYEDGSYVIAGHSVEHTDYPPRKGFVRGYNQDSGYFMKKIELNGRVQTEFCFHSSCDLGGGLFYSLVLRGMASNLSQTVMNLRKCAKDLRVRESED